MAPTASFKAREAEKATSYRQKAATEQFAQATHLLEGFADTLDALPPTLTRSLSDLKELDAVLTAPLAAIHARMTALLGSIETPESMTPAQRLWLLRDLVDECAKYKVGGDDKIRVANGTCESLQTHIKQLDTTTALFIQSLPPRLAPHIHPSTWPTGYPKLTETLRTEPMGGVWGEHYSLLPTLNEAHTRDQLAYRPVINNDSPFGHGQQQPHHHHHHHVATANTQASQFGTLQAPAQSHSRGKGRAGSNTTGAANQHNHGAVGGYSMNADGSVGDKRIHHNQYTKKKAREIEAAAAAAAAAAAGVGGIGQGFPSSFPIQNSASHSGGGHARRTSADGHSSVKMTGGGSKRPRPIQTNLNEEGSVGTATTTSAAPRKRARKSNAAGAAAVAAASGGEPSPRSENFGRGPNGTVVTGSNGQNGVHAPVPVTARTGSGRAIIRPLLPGEEPADLLRRRRGAAAAEDEEGASTAHVPARGAGSNRRGGHPMVATASTSGIPNRTSGLREDEDEELDELDDDASAVSIHDDGVPSNQGSLQSSSNNRNNAATRARRSHHHHHHPHHHHHHTQHHHHLLPYPSNANTTNNVGTSANDDGQPLQHHPNTHESELEVEDNFDQSSQHPANLDRRYRRSRIEGHQEDSFDRDDHQQLQRRRLQESIQDEGFEIEDDGQDLNHHQQQQQQRRRRKIVTNTIVEGLIKGEEDNEMVEVEVEEEEEGQDQKRYCVCRGRVTDGQMVGCDNKTCQKEWFHTKCVGLAEIPAGAWYCPECIQLGFRVR